ncbi:unnamed protein product [Malus baccata var. baccata]
MTASLLTNFYLDRIKLNPTWPVESFLSTVESEWNHGCTKMKAYRALNKAFKIIEGKHAKPYTKLWDFAEEVRKTNPGSTVKLKLDGERCHLKVLHGWQLLCVVGIEPNDETWVIAYAVVEMENKAAGIWFLQLLADDVGIENQNGWAFISDKQNRLISAFQKEFVQGENFEGCSMGSCQKKKTTIPHFKKAMEEVKKLDEEAYKWLVKKPATQWSKSHFETYPNCDILLNNLCESFNVVILVPRQKPIITMLQMIHTMLMKRIQMRRGIMMKQVGDLYPKIKKKLEEAKLLSGRCIAQCLGWTKFQVNAEGVEQYVVDLVEKTCSCRKYKLTGIPCNHAISAIHFKREKPEDYVDAYYSKARYLEVYSRLIMPMNEKDGEQTPTNPPNNLEGPPKPLKLGRKGKESTSAQEIASSSAEATRRKRTRKSKIQNWAL